MTYVTQIFISNHRDDVALGTLDFFLLVSNLSHDHTALTTLLFHRWVLIPCLCCVSRTFTCLGVSPWWFVQEGLAFCRSACFSCPRLVKVVG
ncbi:hypothetical protein GDO78_018284 [Eleutherodactylus coqui]|uniref:Uncharacterized protein n=1 Tax=Eleutherodactylus coqui TaxID=57060 RepID=A0A8J6JYB0_ELECQ|nr:hypothetical protein GDO78_018284 [Eleutherodactylus coqui]